MTLEKILKNSKLSEDQLKALIDGIKNPKLYTENYHAHQWGKNRAKIGLLSDLHIGSKYTNYDIMRDVFKRFKAEDIDCIYIAGDITEGYDRRKGQAFECDLHGVDEQVKGVIERVPDVKKPIKFILGDHDMWHKDNAGVDIGRMIESGRSDFEYLGAFSATIKLNHNTTLMLQHPAKGTAYALSYNIQKMIESFTGGEKPNLLAVGHFHKIEYLFYRNVHAWQTGCMQSQTAWMKRMNLSAHSGAWILDIKYDNKGTVDKINQTLLPYYG